MIVKLLARVALVALTLCYVMPHLQGLKFRGDFWAALMTSTVFNLALWGLECLLAVVVFGINISTLGLGAFLAAGVKFIALLTAPSFALIGTAEVLPKFLNIPQYFPGAFVGGLVIGGLLWALQVENKKS